MQGLQAVDRLQKALEAASSGLDKLQAAFRKLTAPVLRPRLDTSRLETDLRRLDAAFQRPRVIRARLELEAPRSLPAVTQRVLQQATAAPGQPALPPAGGTTSPLLATAAGTALGRGVMAGDMPQQINRLVGALNDNTEAQRKRFAAATGPARFEPPIEQARIPGTNRVETLRTLPNNAPYQFRGAGGGGGGRGPGSGSTLPSANPPDPGRQFQKAAAGAGLLDSSLLRLSAAYLGADQAARQLQQTVAATFERSTAETRLRAVTAAYGEYYQAQQLAAEGAKKFNLGTTESETQFAQLYARLRPVGLQLTEIRDVYEGYATAARLAGATNAEFNNTLTQLVQGIGSGALRGDELRSVLEQAPALAQALAKELDTTVGGLKKLGEQGAISTTAVVKALQRIRTEGADQLAASLDTPAQKFQTLQNRAQDFRVELGRIAMPALEGAIKLITDALVDATAETKRWRQALDNVAEAGDKVNRALTPFVKGITNELSAATKGVNDHFDAWINGLGRMGPLMDQYLQGIARIAQFLAGGGLTNPAAIFGAITDAMQGAATPQRVANPTNLNDIPANMWPAGIPRPGTSPNVDTRPLDQRVPAPSPTTAASERRQERLIRLVEGAVAPGGSRYPMTSPPGMRNGRPHAGTDYGAPEGTPLSYSVGGTVTRIGNDPAGYGRWVEVVLDNGLRSMVAHLDRVEVALGQRFAANQLLAYTGSTGRSTGPHTHVEDAQGAATAGAASAPYLRLGGRLRTVPDSVADALSGAAERAEEERRRTRLSQLDAERERLRLVFQRDSAGQSELRRLELERRLQNDLLYVDRQRAALEADPNASLRNQAELADLDQRAQDLQRSIAALTPETRNLVEQYLDLTGQNPVDAFSTGIREATAEAAALDQAIEDLLLRANQLGAPAELINQLTDLRGQVAGIRPEDVAARRLTTPLQEQLQADAARLKLESGAIRAGRPLNRQEELSLDPVFKALPEARQQQLMEQAKINDGIDIANQKLADQVQLVQSIGAAMAQGIGSAITGLINGTKSLNEALGETLANIGQILIQNAVTGLLGGMKLFGTPLIAGARAEGGPVSSGSSYLVGEQGPELFIPGVSGSILPNKQTAEVLKPAGDYGLGEPQPLEVSYNGPQYVIRDEEYVRKADVNKIIKASTAHTAGQMRSSVSFRRRTGI